jgi:hypothetical protein
MCLSAKSRRSEISALLIGGEIDSKHDDDIKILKILDKYDYAVKESNKTEDKIMDTTQRDQEDTLFLDMCRICMTTDGLKPMEEQILKDLRTLQVKPNLEKV